MKRIRSVKTHARATAIHRGKLFHPRIQRESLSLLTWQSNMVALNFTTAPEEILFKKSIHVE